MGNEWNEPDVIGIDVTPDRIVPYLDEQFFGPFLGHSGTLLELGPGGGRFTEFLLARCGTLIAADTSPAMLEKIRHRFRDLERLKCMLLDGQGLASVPHESVDAVFSYDVFVHLPQWDIFNYMTEFARVLRPGGKAIIHHGNVLSELGWANFLSEIPYTVNRHKHYGNFSIMTPELMENFVRRAGLVVHSLRTDIVKRDGIAFILKGGSPSGA